MTINENGGGRSHQKMTDDGIWMKKKVKESSIISNPRQENTTTNLFFNVLTHFNHILMNFENNVSSSKNIKYLCTVGNCFDDLIMTGEGGYVRR